ncbi:transposase [Polaromonas sp. P2-4]|nr:transposase [Polaromonas sp. P2-4]
MSTTQTVLQGKDTTIRADLYMSFELSDKKWQLTLSDGRRSPGRYSVEAGDTAAVAQCIDKARKHCMLKPQAKVHSCYEAGRDGWWLHRWLVEQGIDNIVVDSASIEVNRHARRAKTDRLDGDKLLAMLLRHCAGERVWSVLHEPSAEDEETRRVHRELARLSKERTGTPTALARCWCRTTCVPASSSAGATGRAGGAAMASRCHRHCATEIERESARLELVKQQVKTLETAQRRELADGKQPLVAQLAQLRAIGPRGAWVLVKELFGWRRFANRRELAGCLGLAPTPYASGDSEIEQGISKAGNKRARLAGRVVVGLAAPATGQRPEPVVQPTLCGRGKRMRRVGIVALARRLAIALWRYLDHGEIPSGAVLKLAAA